MWLDAIALLIFGVFAGIGAWRGALRSGLGLLTLGAAYGAAVLAGPRLGPELAQRLQTSELLGLALAGMGAFLVGLLGMGLLSKLLTRLDRVQPDERSARDRFLGGAFGAVRGGLIVLLLSWLALWIDALQATGTVEGAPSVAGSRAAALTTELVEAGVGAAMSDAGPSGRLVARMAARPGATLTDMQALLESPQLGALQRDPVFWTYVESGAVDAALNRGSFQGILRDAELRRRLGQLGMVDDRAAEDPRAFRSAAADVLREVGPRIRRVKTDPEFQELLADPEVLAAVQGGNTLALVTHPRLRRIVSRALEDEGV